jgi:hypothetical protein
MAERGTMERHAQQEPRQHEEQVNAEITALEQWRQIDVDLRNRQQRRTGEPPRVQRKDPCCREPAHAGQVR